MSSLKKDVTHIGNSFKDEMNEVYNQLLYYMRLEHPEESEESIKKIICERFFKLENNDSDNEENVEATNARKRSISEVKDQHLNEFEYESDENNDISMNVNLRDVIISEENLNIYLQKLKSMKIIVDDDRFNKFIVKSAIYAEIQFCSISNIKWCALNYLTYIGLNREGKELFISIINGYLKVRSSSAISLNKEKTLLRSRNLYKFKVGKPIKFESKLDENKLYNLTLQLDGIFVKDNQEFRKTTNWSVFKRNEKTAFTASEICKIIREISSNDFTSEGLYSFDEGSGSSLKEGISVNFKLKEKQQINELKALKYSKNDNILGPIEFRKMNGEKKRAPYRDYDIHMILNRLEEHPMLNKMVTIDNLSRKYQGIKSKSSSVNDMNIFKEYDHICFYDLFNDERCCMDHYEDPINFVIDYTDEHGFIMVHKNILDKRRDKRNIWKDKLSKRQFHYTRMLDNSFSKKIDINKLHDKVDTIFFDIESIKGDKGTQFPFMVSIALNKELPYSIFIDQNESLDQIMNRIVEGLEDAIRNCKHTKIIIYAHNLFGYDLVTIKKKLLQRYFAHYMSCLDRKIELKKTFIRNKFYLMEYQFDDQPIKKVKFINSGNYLMGSLTKLYSEVKDAFKSVDLDKFIKEKKEMDHENHVNVDIVRKKQKEITKYCENDVAMLQRVVFNLWDIVKEYLDDSNIEVEVGNIFFNTIGAPSLSLYLYSLLYNKEDKSKVMREISSSKFIRKNIRGGIAQIVDSYESKEGEYIEGIDVCSLYSFAMMNPLPAYQIPLEGDTYVFYEETEECNTQRYNPIKQLNFGIITNNEKLKEFQPIKEYNDRDKYVVVVSDSFIAKLDSFTTKKDLDSNARIHLDIKSVKVYNADVYNHLKIEKLDVEQNQKIRDLLMNLYSVMEDQYCFKITNKYVDKSKFNDYQDKDLYVVYIVDVQYDFDKCLETNWYNFAPFPNKEKGRLVTSFVDKINYGVWEDNLKLYNEITENNPVYNESSKSYEGKYFNFQIKGYIVFYQDTFIKNFIVKNIELRKKSGMKSAMGNFAKLLNNSLYGKTCQNPYKYMDSSFKTQSEISEMEIQDDEFIYGDFGYDDYFGSEIVDGTIRINDEERFYEIETKKKNVCVNENPHHIGFAVLEFAKNVMYKKVFEMYNLGIKLFYTDTDSLYYAIKNEDQYYSVLASKNMDISRKIINPFKQDSYIDFRTPASEENKPGNWQPDLPVNVVGTKFTGYKAKWYKIEGKNAITGEKWEKNREKGFGKLKRKIIEDTPLYCVQEATLFKKNSDRTLISVLDNQRKISLKFNDVKKMRLEDGSAFPLSNVNIEFERILKKEGELFISEIRSRMLLSPKKLNKKAIDAIMYQNLNKYIKKEYIINGKGEKELYEGNVLLSFNEDVLKSVYDYCKNI